MTIQHGTHLRRERKPDPLRFNPEAARKRNAIWAHNAQRGSVCLALVTIDAMSYRPTNTSHAKELARRIYRLLQELDTALQTRVGP